MENINKLLDSSDLIQLNADIISETASTLHDSIVTIYGAAESIANKMPGSFRVQFNFDNEDHLMPKIKMIANELKKIREMIEDVSALVQPIEKDASILKERFSGGKRMPTSDDIDSDNDEAAEKRTWKKDVINH